MARSEDQIAAQMTSQLRILDPSISGEIGTPERKVIDTVATQLAQGEVSLNSVGGALDLNAKFGQDLDAFAAIFNFGRLGGSYATGFVTFKRPTPSAYDIPVPSGTQVIGNNFVAGQAGAGTVTVTFRTTQRVTMVAGQTSVIAPIQALVPGKFGNLAANTITGFANVGSPILGITEVTNETPTENGDDRESDDQFKVRLRNTIFRNVAGTDDQYTALALATQFSTKANVVGPISRWQEYLQIPNHDDSNTGGATGHYTTVASSNNFAQYIYSEAPYFVSNGQNGVGTIFYRQDFDFQFNLPPLNLGDTQRESQNPLSTQPNVTFLNVLPLDADSEATGPRAGQVALLEYSYLSQESRNDISRNITNCVDVFVNGVNPTTVDTIIATPTSASPTFNNIPTSALYRENFRRIGQPDHRPTASWPFTPLFWQPMISLPDKIVAGDSTYFLDQHYFAVEEISNIGHTTRARNGIEWNPGLPGATSQDPLVKPWTYGSDWNLDDYTVYNGVYYHAAVVITNSKVSPDQAGSQYWVPQNGSVSPFTGVPIIAASVASFNVAGYQFDRNIYDLQAALEANKQTTTDILAHSATQRYFKFALTVVYSQSVSASSVNQSLYQSLADYLNGSYFGTTIQLSDLIVVIRNISGVQNVRWTRDIQDDNVLGIDYRVIETDINGVPRSLGGAQKHINDFGLSDNELPALPATAQPGDTLPGLIVQQRAQSNFRLL